MAFYIGSYFNLTMLPTGGDPPTFLSVCNFTTEEVANEIASISTKDAPQIGPVRNIGDTYIINSVTGNKFTTPLRETTDNFKLLSGDMLLVMNHKHTTSNLDEDLKDTVWSLVVVN